MRFVQGTFPDAYDTTIGGFAFVAVIMLLEAGVQCKLRRALLLEDVHVKSVQFMGRRYNLKITDTAGQVSLAVSTGISTDGYSKNTHSFLAAAYWMSTATYSSTPLMTEDRMSTCDTMRSVDRLV